MEILLAIDALDDLVRDARLVPFTNSVRVDEEKLGAAAARIRSAAAELFGALPGRIGSIAELYAAIDELETLGRDSRRVPLTTQLRVDKQRVDQLLDRMRATLPTAVAESRGGAPVDPALWKEISAAIYAFEDFLDDARKIPRSDSARVDERELNDVSARLHTAVTDFFGPTAPADGPLAEVFAAIAGVDGIVRAGTRVRRTGELEIAREALLDLLDDLSAALPEAAVSRRTP